MSIIERLRPWSRDRGGAPSIDVLGRDAVRTSLEQVVRSVDRRVEVAVVGRPGRDATGDVVADMVLEATRSVGRRAILPDREGPDPTELVGVPVGAAPGPDVVVLRVPECLEDDRITELELALRAEVARIARLADPAARWTLVDEDRGLLSHPVADAHGAERQRVER